MEAMIRKEEFGLIIMRAQFYPATRPGCNWATLRSCGACPDEWLQLHHYETLGTTYPVINKAV